MNSTKKTITKRKKFLSGSRLSKFSTNVKKVAHMKGKMLKEILRYNRQSMTGTKDILFGKVAHGMTFGRIPRCPNCKSGRPFFNLATGTYLCKGFQDDDDYIECNKKFTHEEMKPLMLEWKMKAGVWNDDNAEDVDLESVTTVSCGST